MLNLSFVCYIVVYYTLLFILHYSIIIIYAQEISILMQCNGQAYQHSPDSADSAGFHPLDSLSFHPVS